MNLFKFGEEFWGKEWKKRGVFHYFTLSGLLSLSAKASDERVWPLAWMSLSWFPGSLIRSGHSRAVKVKVKPLSHVQLFATPWTVVCQATLSVGFSRQEYWSGLPCPPPGDLPNPGMEPRSPALQVNAFTIWATRAAPSKSFWFWLPEQRHFP